MTTRHDDGCVHERDVLDLVAVGQWPGRADAALTSHVAGCATCREVAAVAVVVLEWADDPRPVTVPDASVVWYRAQVRAREEAARRASRPVLAAQLVALATVILALTTIGPSAQWYLALVPDLTLPTWSWPDTSSGAWLGWGVLAVVSTVLLVGSLAWALADE
ncbi:MAG: hypothetical protein O2917_03540 [Acidobacteria bacterium]|nr:hypothetical protein [Acidobacteriota bacterium]